MENKEPKIGYPDQARKRKALRIVGFVFVAIGTLLIGVGLISMMGAMYGGFPSLFFLFFLGIPLEFAGAVCLMLGYFGAVSRFQAGESAPVAKDTANYFLDGTRNETAKTIGEAVMESKEQGPLCPKCGMRNEVGAVYCDHCGAALTKKCPHCGEINDGDSSYCRKCGEHL